MVAIPLTLHLAVHVLGMAVAFGLTALAVSRRRSGRAWLAFGFGGLLIGASHIADGALLAGDVGWPVYLRAAGYAALAVGAAGGLVRAGATGSLLLVALAPPSAHLAAAVAGLAAAGASVGGILGRRRDALVAGAGLVLWAGADLAAHTDAVLSAVLSLVGSVALGVWLLHELRTSLLSRFVASFVAALLVLVVGLATVSGLLLSTDVERDQLDRLADIAAARGREVSDEWTQQAIGAASPFARSAGLSRRLADDPPVALDADAAQVADVARMDVVVIVDAAGAVRGSHDRATGEPLSAATEVLLGGAAPVASALRGAEGRGVVAVGTDDVVAVGAIPVFEIVGGDVRRDVQVGALVAGRSAAKAGFVDLVKAGAAADATVVVGDVAADSTLPAAAGAQLARLGPGPPRTVTVGGAATLVATAPVFDVDGTIVAFVVVSLDAGSLAGVEEGFSRTLFLVALAGAATAAGLAAWASSRTTRPVRALTGAAERVAAGNLDVRVALGGADEVGRLSGAFDHMTGSLAERERQLRAAAALESALRGRLEVLTTSMGEALLAVDPNGHVQTLNPAGERLLRLSTARAVGVPVERVLTGSDLGGASLLDALGHADADDARAVRGAVRRGQRITPVAATAAPLRGTDGTHLGRVYVLRDVTGEAEVERMKTEFLSNISHELRTPLTPIKGYAEVLRRKDVGREHTIEFADTILSSTGRLERIIGMLVDFAALEAGRMPVRLEPTTLDGLVSEVLKRTRAAHPTRKVTRRLARGLPAVSADPELLARILDELLDNAVKFSQGPIVVLAEPDGRRVRLTVRDKGQGIEADKLAVILRDFHQADASATRRIGGLGLGLSIVQRIADRFGADLRVASEPGMGTDVHLLLRVASAKAAA